MRIENNDFGLVGGIILFLMVGGSIFFYIILVDKLYGNPLQGEEIKEIVKEDIENIRLDNELQLRLPYLGEFEYYKKNYKFSKDIDFVYKYATDNNYDEVRYTVLNDLVEKDLLLDKGTSSTEEDDLYQLIVKNQLLYEWSKFKDYNGDYVYDTNNLTIQQPQVALLDKTSKIELEGMFTSEEIGYTQTIHPELFMGYPQVHQIDKDSGTYSLLTVSYLPLGIWETQKLENIIASFVPTAEQVKFITGEQFLQSTEQERTTISDLTEECVVNGAISDECLEQDLSSQDTIDMYDQGLRKSVDVVESYFRFSPTISYLIEPKELLIGGVPIQVTYLIEKLPTEDFKIEITDKTYHMQKIKGNKTVPLTIDWN